MYIRVSTVMQATEGVSLEAQQDRARLWTQANGYAIADRDIHVDAGLSGGRADNRPGLQAALENACKDGPALVVYSLSRLARSVADTIQTAARLEEAGADLVSLSENVDTTSAAGRMVFRMLAVLAEFEKDLVSERTSVALQHKRAKGEFIGGDAPFGFVVSHGRLTAHEPEQAVIRQARALRAEGLTLRAVAVNLEARGHRSRSGRGFAPIQVARMVEAR